MLNISMAAKTEISQTFNTGHSSCNSTSTVKISKMQGAKATDKMSILRQNEHWIDLKAFCS